MPWYDSRRARFPAGAWWTSAWCWVLVRDRAERRQATGPADTIFSEPGSLWRIMEVETMIIPMINITTARILIR
jgi:hypothetical protein